jgi:hypothetical protein
VIVRTVIVGDVHGCLAELDALLAAVGLSPHDRLVLVGDLVARGPDSGGVVKRLRELGARSVRGNHEERLLASLRGERPFAAKHEEAARALDDGDVAWLAALPLSIDLPEHDARVIHAGLLPGVPWTEQDPRVLVSIRTVGGAGEPREDRGATPWGRLYAGAPHVVFGHDAIAGLQLHRDATGLDTGAVYGRRLSALVLHDGEAPLPLAARASQIVSVPARRAYHA